MGQTDLVFDTEASYEFVFVAPVEERPLGGYSKGDAIRRRQLADLNSWKRVLNYTTFTIGCNDVFWLRPADGLIECASYAEFIFDWLDAFFTLV